MSLRSASCQPNSLKALHTHNFTHMTVSRLSWFREKHSTQTSRHKLISVTQIKNTFYTYIQNGKIIGMLDLDLWKVFDTVNKKILLHDFF